MSEVSVVTDSDRLGDGLYQNIPDSPDPVHPETFAQAIVTQEKLRFACDSDEWIEAEQPVEIKE